MTNVGQVAYAADSPASFTDDLSGVLDDASYNDDVSSGASVSGTTLTWAGPLDIGEIVKVTYSVTVADPATGDSKLRNAVVPTAAGGECAEEGCVTLTTVPPVTPVPPATPVPPVDGGSTPVPPVDGDDKSTPPSGLANTGSDAWFGAGLAGALLLATGAVLLVARSRRRSAIDSAEQ